MRMAILVTVTAVAVLVGAWFALSGGDGTASAGPSLEPREVAAEKAKAPLRILFLGNSFTGANDLPRLIANMTAAGNEKVRIEYEAEVPGGMTLDGHWKSGRAYGYLKDRKWDRVVLQEQSQVPEIGGQPRQMMYEAARMLDKAARADGARTTFYVTWGYKDGDRRNFPDDTYEKMQARLVDGYGTIARELGADQAPVGQAWSRAHAARPDLKLWADDGMHPSPLGTYLAACVFYTVIHGHPPSGNLFHPGVSDADARFLQQVAADTVK